MLNPRLNVARTGILASIFVSLLGIQRVCPAQQNASPNKIPKNVLSALKAKFPNAEIDKSTKEKEGGVLVYDLEFKQKGHKFEADIKENGTIVNWEKQIPAGTLPSAARKSVAKKYPKSSVKEVMEVTAVKGGKDSPEGYEVLLQTVDKKNVEVTVSRNGLLLEEPGTKK